MKTSYLKALWAGTALIMLSGCSSYKLNVSSVDYQSFRTEFAQPTEIPDNAKIAASYLITSDGKLIVIVKNLTDEIVTIDQTRSFFTDPSGNSSSYYDPNVTSTSETQFSSSTNGASFGLGALANAFGIGGTIGSLLGGIGLNTSSTSGNAQTKTVYFKDMPQVSLAPKSHGVMSKEFKIDGIGFGSASTGNFNCSFKDSPIKFSFHLSYSFDNGQTYDRLSTNIYVNSSISIPVTSKKVNKAFREIYAQKHDALSEPAYMFHIRTNAKSTGTPDLNPLFYDSYTYGGLIDFK